MLKIKTPGPRQLQVNVCRVTLLLQRKRITFHDKLISSIQSSFEILFHDQITIQSYFANEVTFCCCMNKTVTMVVLRQSKPLMTFMF